MTLDWKLWKLFMAPDWSLAPYDMAFATVAAHCCVPYWQSPDLSACGVRDPPAWFNITTSIQILRCLAMGKMRLGCEL